MITRRKMKINKLEQAEAIVKKSIDMHWDGWTIVKFKRSKAAEFSKDGMRYKGVWGFANRYVPTKDGWNLPNESIRRD